MAIAQLDIHQGYALFEKASHETKMHRHYGIELIFCRNGSFDLSTQQREYIGINAAIIPSTVPHTFKCVDSPCQLLFLDPLSPLGRYISQYYFVDERHDVSINPVDIELFFDDQSLLGITRQKEMIKESKLDFRIQNCITTIQNNLNDEELSIRELSMASYLSESRLSHLFRERVGISIRQFVLWNKMFFAISRSNDGYSLTSAAHSAGFVDSSHFNKVFINMFGSNPFKTLKT